MDMATLGLVNKIKAMTDDMIAADATFTFANSDAQYTTYKIEMPFTGNTSFKTVDGIMTIKNPSTETALTVDVFNIIEDFDDMDAMARIDTFTVTAKDAHVDPTEVWYYDASGNSLAADVTDFTDNDADDVSIPGHAAAEVGDYLMIGHTIPFNQLYLDVSTPMTDACTLDLQYANAAGTWTTLDTNVTINSVAESATVAPIDWTIPTDWAKYDPAAIGGSNPGNYYWIRIKCTAFDHAHTQGLIKQGKISTIIENDTIQRKITGLYHGSDRVVVTVNNATAVGAAKTIAGAGGFSGVIRLSAL